MPTAARKRSRPPVWQKLALVAGGLLFALIVAELGARLVLGAMSARMRGRENWTVLPNGSPFDLRDIIQWSENPRLVYSLTPNREGDFKGVPHQTNSHGMRGPESSVEKPDSVFRIAMLGDSTLFGWRVLQEQAYPAVLERHLNSVGDPVRYEVLNFGVPGYNTAMETELFKTRVSLFQPDLVVMQFDLNDLSIPNFLEERPSFWSPRRSFLVDFARDVLSNRKAMEAVARMAAPRLADAPVGETETSKGRVFFMEYRPQNVPPRYRDMVGWEGVFKAMRDLWALTPAPVVHLSNPWPLSEQSLIETGDDDPLARFIEKEKTETPSLSERIYFVDISTAGRDFAEARGIGLYSDMVVEYPRDLHPGPERHILLAREIYLGLVKNKIPPKDSKHYEAYEKVAEAMTREAAVLWEARRQNPSGD